ncbi:MAG: hypothetical protein KAW12_00710 [Candidatus Aminicenantes bacterium]|nr:hypothetical protein [Candidatus Aminicenantes bacterium]
MADIIGNCVVAHRGAHKHGPGSPNSMTAFKDAIKKGFAAFECDVLLSKDEKVVVVHGPTTGCDGGRPDIPVHSSTYEELRRVSLSSGDFIPLLADVLQEVTKQDRTGIIIEIKQTKNGKDLLLARKVCALVHELKARGLVQYISFNYRQLLEVLKTDPTARCSPIEGGAGHQSIKKDCRKKVSGYVKDGMWGVDFNSKKYNKTLVRECRRAGLRLNVWTVNRPKEMEKFKDWGFDFITTDEPEKCLEVMSL